MQPQSLQEQTKEFINSMLSQVGCDAETVPRTAASVLHRLTGYPVIFYNFVSEDVFVKQIKLLPVNRKTVVLLLILSDGRTKNSVCHIRSGTNSDITTEFIKIVKEINSMKGSSPVPTLIIRGELDELVKKDVIKIISDRLTGIKEIYEVPNIGHMMLRTDYEQEIIEKIIYFLER